MLDLANWRSLDRIKTHSLWLTERGDFSQLSPSDFGVPEFHGRYHPEIPFQMMSRYVEPGELVWDVFAGGAPL